MKRIAALSLAVASIILMSSPTYAVAVPWGKLIHGAEEAAEKGGGKAAKKAAEEAAERAAAKAAAKDAAPSQILKDGAGEAGLAPEGAAMGRPAEVDPTTGNPLSGNNDTPTQILRDGAGEAGLDPENAVKGAPAAPAAADNVPATVPVPIGAGASSVTESGSGGALPIAGGAALAAYGIYRVIKARR
jgi:hypothetical protein